MNKLSKEEKLAKERSLVPWLIMSFDDLNKIEKQIVNGIDVKNYKDSRTKITMYDNNTDFIIQLFESYQVESPQNMFDTYDEDNRTGIATHYNTFYIIELENEQRYIYSIDNYKTFDLSILFRDGEQLLKYVYEVTYIFKTNIKER